MGFFTCHKDYRANKAVSGLSESQRTKLLEKMDNVVKDYQTDKNLIEAGYANDTETMRWLFRKATGKVLDFEVNPITIKDARKFDIRRKGMSKDIEKQGKGTRWFFDFIKIPKAISRRFPQLDKFQHTLSDEASFFRANQLGNNAKISSVIKNWDTLAKNHGGDIKKLRRLEYDLDKEISLPFTKDRAIKINELEKELTEFRLSGSAKTFRHFHELMNGLDVEQLSAPKHGYSKRDMGRWREMDKNIKEVRQSGANILGRGLQKVMQTAKIIDGREGNYRDLTSVVEKAQDMIRNIEFQRNIDLEGKPKTYESMKDFEMMSSYGFSKAEMGQISQRKYMPLYVLGATRLLRQIQVAMRDTKQKDRPLLGKEGILTKDFEAFQKSVDRVESRGGVFDPRYSIDPAYFMKKYIYDASAFNFHTHLENNFMQQTASLLDMHARASSKGNQDIMDMSDALIRQMHEIKNSLTQVDGHSDAVINDLSRVLTSVTYFRLMGGNVRSALRNASQRMYEFVEYGWKARKQSKQWYRENVDNQTMVKRQAAKYGLNWYMESEGVFGNSERLGMSREESTRGAVAGSTVPKGYQLDSYGELVRAAPGLKTISRKAADTAGAIAGATGRFHKLAEDWNRGSTFRISFGLVHSNLETLPKGYVLEQINATRKNNPIKMENLNDKMIIQWRENTAGKMAYNLTSDLHFEYAKWAKAKPFGGSKGKLAAPAGQALGQFMHYRMSMFDLMAKWAKDAGVSMRAGDFTSHEMFKIYRMGLLYSFTRGLSIVSDVNFNQLVQNDVVEEMKKLITFFSADRDNPKEMEAIKEATYGQGAWTFAGPNLIWAANIGEAVGMWDLGENSFFDKAQMVQGNDEFKREQKYKMMSLVSGVGARWHNYTIPMMGKRDWFTALKGELGFHPDPDVKEMRTYLDATLKEVLPRNIAAAIGKEGSYPRGWKKRQHSISARRQPDIGHREGRRLSVAEARKVYGSLDYLRGQATPKQVLNRRKGKRGRALDKRVMEPLELREAIEAGFF